MRLNVLHLSFEELSDGLSKSPFLLGVVKHHPPRHDKEYIQEFAVSAVVLSRSKIKPSTTAFVLIQEPGKFSAIDVELSVKAFPPITRSYIRGD